MKLDLCQSTGGSCQVRRLATFLAFNEAKLKMAMSFKYSRYKSIDESIAKSIMTSIWKLLNKTANKPINWHTSSP